MANTGQLGEWDIHHFVLRLIQGTLTQHKMADTRCPSNLMVNSDIICSIVCFFTSKCHFHVDLALIWPWGQRPEPLPLPSPACLSVCWSAELCVYFCVAVVLVYVSLQPLICEENISYLPLATHIFCNLPASGNLPPFLASEFGPCIILLTQALSCLHSVLLSGNRERICPSFSGQLDTL